MATSKGIRLGREGTGGSGSTDAADITSNVTPDNFTPTTNDLDGMLTAIDTALGTINTTISILPEVTEWTSFTPTGTWLVNTTYTGSYRLVGDMIEVRYNLALTGAPTSADLKLNLPDGFAFSGTTGEAPRVFSSEVRIIDVNVPIVFPGAITSGNENGTQFTINYYRCNASGTPLSNFAVSASAPMTFANGDAITVLACGLVKAVPV